MQIQICIPSPWPLGACSAACVHSPLCVRCPWPLVACSPVYVPSVLCVQCPWPLDASMPVCAPGVLSLQRLSPLGTGLCAACALCGLLRSVALLCVPTGSSVRPARSCALRVLGGVCVLRGGRGRLAPGSVPWLSPEACLPGVPCAPALVPRASSGMVAPGVPVGSGHRVLPYHWLTPLDLPGGSAGHLEAGQEPDSWCLLLAPAMWGRQTHSVLYPFGAPLWACP